MHVDHEPYYQDRLTTWDLCHDFPEDEMYINGLHAMQCHFYSHNVPVEIPVVRVMNAAHFLLAYVFQTTCSDNQSEYDVLAYGSVGHDKKVMLLTLIVLAAMLKRTEGFRARQCRNMLLEDRSEDFYDGVSLYDQFLSSEEKHFAEEDFLLDTHNQIAQLQEENTRLISENITLKHTITTMEKESRPQTVIHVAGDYIAEMTISNDIHDNHNCPIYACPTNPSLASAPGVRPEKDSTSPSQGVSAESILGIPAERDYKAVRIYIEERSRFDPEFKTFCDANTRVAICERLSKEFGWIVDPYGLGRNINRKRKKKS